MIMRADYNYCEAHVRYVMPLMYIVTLN